MAAILYVDNGSTRWEGDQLVFVLRNKYWQALWQITLDCGSGACQATRLGPDRQDPPAPETGPAVADQPLPPATETPEADASDYGQLQEEDPV